MLATGTDQWSTLADSSFIGKSALNPSTNWASLLGGSNDDAGVCDIYYTVKTIFLTAELPVGCSRLVEDCRL
jgi:hypothetical protein